MHLQAVIVPPQDAIEGALQLVTDVFTPEPKPGAHSKRSRKGWLSKPRRVEDKPELVWVPDPPEALFVRVSKFGNVSLTDTGTLAEALERSASTWPSPMLHIASVTVGEMAPFDVVAQLEGDLDGLFGVFRKVLDIGKQHEFFLDRRSFRTEIRLGSVEVPEGAEVPAELPGVVLPLDGPPWRADNLTLVSLTAVGAPTAYEERAVIALG